MNPMTEGVQTLLVRELNGFAKEIEAFPDDELMWATVPGVANSSANLALHVCGNLQHFIGACAGAPVHVIAHSMGNRVLARTLVRLRSAQPGARIDQLIFAAPDIDQDTFASLALQFRDVAKQATLYVSARDSAVELSRVFHRAARAGLYPPVTILPGVDTVAVTNVDTSMLGHGYVAEARDVLHDMHSVLHFGMTPQQRMGLRLMATSGSQHWLIGS